MKPTEVQAKLQITFYNGYHNEYHSDGDTTATHAMQSLVEKSYSNATEIDGGFSSWTKAGYHIDQGH